MSRHRLDLETTQKGRKLKGKTKAALMAGEITLSQALGIENTHIDGLKDQALALMKTGKWARAADLFTAIEVLGLGQPSDALLMMRCLTALGEHEDAEVYMAKAQVVLHIMEEQLANKAE